MVRGRARRRARSTDARDFATPPRSVESLAPHERQALPVQPRTSSTLPRFTTTSSVMKRRVMSERSGASATTASTESRSTDKTRPRQCSRVGAGQEANAVPVAELVSASAPRPDARNGGPSPEGPAADRVVAKVRFPLGVRQGESEAGSVVKRRAQGVVARGLRWAHENRPVSIVSVDVRDQGVEHEVASEHVECAERRWHWGLRWGRETLKRSPNRVDAVAAVGVVIRVVLIVDLAHQHWPCSRAPRCHRASSTMHPRVPARVARSTCAAGVPIRPANSHASFSAMSSPSDRSRSGRAGLNNHVRSRDSCFSQSCACMPGVPRRRLANRRGQPQARARARRHCAGYISRQPRARRPCQQRSWRAMAAGRLQFATDRGSRLGDHARAAGDHRTCETARASQCPLGSIFTIGRRPSSIARVVSSSSATSSHWLTAWRTVIPDFG